MTEAMSRRRAREVGLLATCFLLCIPSGGAVLAKVYGLAAMRDVTLKLILPCSLLLVAIWLWARRGKETEIAARLEAGFWGGLLGSIGYDLVRIPFALAGFRVFATISAFGIWVTDANSSSRFTEIAGWAYHYSNGICFGIMYALVMQKKYWVWAIPWALLLESIAVFSPFGKIFDVYGNYPALGIAYFAHLAYGAPLGYVAQYWDRTHTRIKSTPALLRWTVVGVAALIALRPLVSQDEINRDRSVVPSEFRVEGRQLRPDWLRIRKGESIQIYNPEGAAVSVYFPLTRTSIEIPGKATKEVSFPQTGIHQVYVQTQARSRSSFVMVEPVEENN